MDTELGVAFALIIDEIWAKPAFTKAEELFAEVCRHRASAPSDENVHKPKLKYKCTVCGSETDTPRINYTYNNPLRCQDYMCDEPLKKIN